MTRNLGLLGAVVCLLLYWHTTVHAAGESPKIVDVITGFNVYAPSFVATGKQIFFGGWLYDTHKPFDRIFRCRAPDLIGDHQCNAPQQVLSPSNLPVHARHVNDPSVEFDASRNSYVMAFTVCVRECLEQKDNEVWVGRTSDWNTFTVLNRIVDSGAAEPSLMLSASGKTASIFFTVRGNASAIWRVDLDAATLLPMASPSVILRDREDQQAFAVSGIDLRYQGNRYIAVWNRFYPASEPSGHDPRVVTIAYAISYDQVNWTRPAELVGPSGSVCAFITPSILEAGQGRIQLLSGVIESHHSGVCPLTNWSRRIVEIETELPQN
jgi:hypothetical protein